MELRHIRYFKAVAEEKSFTKAAEQLAIAQPPLSRQIQDLEAELGTTLFLRTPHKVSLTEEGEPFPAICESDPGPGEPVGGGCQRAQGRIAGNVIHCFGRGLWSPAFRGMDRRIWTETSPCTVQSVEWKYG